MKKLFSVLCVVVSVFIILNTKVWALPDQVQPKEYSGSQTVKSTPATVYSAIVSYVGVTVGDKVQLKDATTDTGNVRFTCVAATANGTCVNNYVSAAFFDTAVYLKETKAGSGTFFTDIQMF